MTESGEYQIALPEPLESDQQLPPPSSPNIEPKFEVKNARVIEVDEGVPYYTGPLGGIYKELMGFAPTGATARVLSEKTLDRVRNLRIMFETPQALKGKTAWVAPKGRKKGSGFR